MIEDGIERQIGPHDIHGVLYNLREACRPRSGSARDSRSRQSGRSSNSVLRYAGPTSPREACPRTLVWFSDRTAIDHLAAYGNAHRKPKPDAIKKRLAADYALDLCERFGVKTTTARTGKFCLVAAALLGDPDVDLQYHCMKAISQKPALK